MDSALQRASSLKSAAAASIKDLISDLFYDPEIAREVPTAEEAAIERLRWQVLADPDVVAALSSGPEFGELRGTAFQTGPWLAALARSATLDEETAQIVVGLDGEVPAIIMPLGLRVKGGVRRLSWLGDTVNDYSAPLLSPKLWEKLTPRSAETIWRKAAAAIGGADYIVAGHQPVRLHGQANPFVCFNAIREVESSHAARFAGEWPEIERALLSTATRKRLKEKRRALERVDNVSLNLFRTASDIRNALDLLISWKMQQLDARGVSNPFRRESFVKLLHDAAIGDVGQANVRVFGLCVGDQIYAAAVILVGDGHWLLYQTAHDANAGKRYSSGQLLILDLLRQAALSGAEVFDFGFGDDSYKQRFCNETIELAKTVKALTPRGFVALMAELGRHHIRGRLKQSALGYKLATGMRRMLTGTGPEVTRPAQVSKWGNVR